MWKACMDLLGDWRKNIAAKHQSKPVYGLFSLLNLAKIKYLQNK